MKLISNLFCIVGAFVLGFHAQGMKETEQTQVHLSDGYRPSNMPPSAIVCIGHCDTIERLNEVDRERFLAKARERVASYETATSPAGNVNVADIEGAATTQLEPGMLGFRYEIIRESEDPEQIARASRQFPNGWVWGLFDGGGHVAMPIANNRIPSSELLEWWRQHEPERYQNYMENGLYGLYSDRQRLSGMKK